MRLSTTAGAVLGMCALTVSLGAWAWRAQAPALPHEVAPVVANPTEPETRTLTPDEADAALVADWLFQAEGRPLARRARQELQWTRDLAARIARMNGAPDLAAELAELERIERQYANLASEPPMPTARDAKGVPAGLLARWTFDGDVRKSIADASGSGADAAVTGAPEQEAGVFGAALAADGATTADTDTRLKPFIAGSYTISAWIQTTSQEADILGTGVGDGHFLLMAYRGVIRGHQWTSSSGNVIDGATRVDDGKWHHVAEVVSDRAISLYVDGRLDATLPMAGERVVAKAPVLIAGRQKSGGPSFTGLLDDLCVYGRALSAEEIAREAEAGRAALALSAAPPSDEARDFYLAVRRVKRRIAFRNPTVDFDRVLFIDQPYPQGSEWAHEARHRNGMMAMPGGRLLALTGLGPGGEVKRVPTPVPGAFWRPDISFDGRKVLFCWKPWNEKSFHLYEADVDGTRIRQFTDGPYDDIDPIYLPDGRIMFSTTRCNTYVRCMPYTFSYVLARCNADGSDVYLVSQNSEPDWCPSLMNDGRAIYSRWEYTDKALWRIQSLWTTNPDGTGTATFWGNQSVWPDHLAEPRAIPNSRRVMFTGLAHHDWFAGSIGIIDPALGRNYPDGLTKVTREVAWPECGAPPKDPGEAEDYHSSGRFGAYKTPYPLSEEDFLVSARRNGKFVLYLMDVHGNRELIYEGAYNVWHAMPLKPRPAPPGVPDRVMWPGTGAARQPAQPGTFYSSNVWQGVPQLRGKVKYLRVIQMDPKTYSLWTRDARFSGPSMSAFQEDGIKRILGTVPVQADGSVSFRAPAGVALHFQLLDAQGRALQTMRSFAGVMPGEKRGCVGCHEQHSIAPGNANGKALHLAAADLTPPPWGKQSICYARFVQPTLDRYCGSCHQGAGAARKAYDLTLRPAGVYVEPYVSLVNSGMAGAILCENYAQSDPASYVTLPPMTYLSPKSKLVEMASSGKHYGVRVDALSLRKLTAWVDANCPYRGEEDVRSLPDPTYPGLASLGVHPLCKSAPTIPRP